MRVRLIVLLALTVLTAAGIYEFGSYWDSEPVRAASVAQWGVYQEKYPPDSSQINALAVQLGRPASVVHWYSVAASKGAMDSWDLNDNFVRAQLVAGVTPMITWEFWNGSNDGTNPMPLTAIASGQFDSYIDSFAQGIASLAPGVVYLRPFHEMNDPYETVEGRGYPWSIVEGNYFGNSPGDLVAAWRHVHDRFVRAGATNVRWVFNPDGDLKWKPLPSTAYPGDDVVDFIGWDLYEGTDSTVQEDYEFMNKYNSTKPMLNGEVGGLTPKWIDHLVANLHRMPRLAGLVWFDEGQYSFERHPKVLEAVKQLLVETKSP